MEETELEQKGSNTPDFAVNKRSLESTPSGFSKLVDDYLAEEERKLRPLRNQIKLTHSENKAQDACFYVSVEFILSDVLLKPR